MQARSEFIVSLSDTSAGLAQVGGKGASLACLAAASLCEPGERSSFAAKHIQAGMGTRQ